MLRRILGAVLATTSVAAPGALLVPAGTAAAVPAARAAACPSASGITVVVDFQELGGGATAGCDANAGGPASTNFRDAGYQLSYSQAEGMDGFVCRIQNKPADGDCAETDQFWSLWWSDGKSGKWAFSSRGVESLSVPEGGYVAFAWHQGGGSAQPPAAVPVAHQDAEPTPEPDDDDQQGGAGGNQGPGERGGAEDDDADDPSETDEPSSTPGASPTDGATDGKRARKADRTPARDRDREKTRGDDAATAPSDPSGSALPEVSDLEGPPPEATADEEGSSLPTWIAIGLAVLVLGAAAAVPLSRRRAG